MARAMFEYTKTVLEKVSFNKELFKNLKNNNYDEYLLELYVKIVG